MNILCACEESQAVTKEFRRLGHRAFSCDLQECSGGHPEWHILGDVLPLLNGETDFVTQDWGNHRIDGKWDMIIAFPPCTHLAVSGARFFEQKRKDGRQREAIEFFCKFLEADCERICIENPVNIISGGYIKEYFPELAERHELPIKPTQWVHPWMFGDKAMKKTCFWMKGLPKLVPEVTDQPDLEFKEWITKDGRKNRQEMWNYNILKNTRTQEERAKARSKTFPGIARAMAETWGGAE